MTVPRNHKNPSTFEEGYYDVFWKHIEDTWTIRKG